MDLRYVYDTVDAAENSFIVKSSRLRYNFPEKLCLNSKTESQTDLKKKLYFEGHKRHLTLIFLSLYFNCAPCIILYVCMMFTGRKHNLQLI
jgi:hypothetical protein